MRKMRLSQKMRLLMALLAMMALIVSSMASPATADHWDYEDDPEGECGWMEVWDESIFYPYWEFEGYEYDCHENWWDWNDDEEEDEEEEEDDSPFWEDEEE